MASITDLSLSDEEEELEITIDVPSNQTIDTSASLVGRFLTDKPIRGYMMTEIIAEFSHAVLQTQSSRCFKLQINSFALELVQSESLRIVL